MTERKPANIVASVGDRLRSLARRNREEFQYVLTRYAIERLLYRLSKSSVRERFILKGATLFTVWTGNIHRITRDLDLLGSGSPKIADVEPIFRELCEISVEDDGLTFSPETVQSIAMRAEEEYEGVRITLTAYLGKARIPLQVDIGFGDAVTPAALETTLPTLLDFPAPVLSIYPRETVLAEKCEAMVDLSLTNTRMKDFYDIWYLSRNFNFEGRLLTQAFRATFQRRGTTLPTDLPVALTSEFADSGEKQMQWNSFIRKSGSIEKELTLPEIVASLTIFLVPIFQASQTDMNFDLIWSPEAGVWEARS